tara:strand:- start:1140 stop:1442 length:303 start_codon:yes stop_codon:yes gene_type:complete
MTKSILALCFLFSLVFSILAPSVSYLLHLDHDEVALIDSAKEESQKEVETSIDEDIIITQSVSKLPSYYLEEDNRVLNFYKDDSSIYASSVHLPPPEFNA